MKPLNNAWMMYANRGNKSGTSTPPPPDRLENDAGTSELTDDAGTQHLTPG